MTSTSVDSLMHAGRQHHVAFSLLHKMPVRSNLSISRSLGEPGLIDKPIKAKVLPAIPKSQPVTPDHQSTRGAKSGGAERVAWATPPPPNSDIWSEKSGATSYQRRSNTAAPSQARRKVKHALFIDQNNLTKPNNGDFVPQASDPQLRNKTENVHRMSADVDAAGDSTFDKNFLSDILHSAAPLAKPKHNDEKEADAPMAKKADIRQGHEKETQLIMEEILHDVMKKMMKEVAAYVYDLSAAHGSANDLAAIIEEASGGLKYEAMFGSVKHFLDQHQFSRRLRRQPWQHTQDLCPYERDESDVRLVDFSPVLPLDLLSSTLISTQPDFYTMRISKSRLVEYKRIEAAYWKNMTIVPRPLPITAQCRGVTSATRSHSQQHIVLGTKGGDVCVVALELNTPHPLRCFALGLSPSENCVIGVSVNSDLTHISTVNADGSLTIWSAMPGQDRVQNLQSTDLALPTNQSQPSTLQPIMSLDAMQDDFKFHSGPYAEAGLGSDSSRPLVAAFYPTTLRQLVVCLALDSKDVLKCDLTGGSAEAKHSNVTCIAYSIPVELHRAHRHPIIMLDLVGGHIGGHVGGHVESRDCKMVSVDSQGFINIWSSSAGRLTPADWSMPMEQYRLSMTESTYRPSPDDYSTTKIYAPRNATTLSDILREKHVVTRDSRTNVLHTYLTHLYAPTEVSCTRLLHCGVCPMKEHLMVLMLFPQLSSREAHVKALVISLSEMRVVFRDDIQLSEEGLYHRCSSLDIATCDMTLPLTSTGSMYFFVCIDGLVSGYSISSHQKILVIAEAGKQTIPGFSGLFADRKTLGIGPSSRMIVNSGAGTLCLTFYSPDGKQSGGVNPVTVLELIDSNTKEQRVGMQRAFQYCSGISPLLTNARNFSAGSPPNENGNPSVEWVVRETLKSIVDSILLPREKKKSSIVAGSNMPHSTW